MKRSKLIHFTAIQTQSKFSIRASINYSSITSDHSTIKGSEQLITAPFQSLSLLGSDVFRIKLIGLNQSRQRVFRKIFESDSYGNFEFKIPINDDSKDITSFQIYEISSLPGIELLLGTRIPIKLKYPKKVIISDFDKTLVDTRYSTPVEVYESLRNPINFFPTIAPSVEIFKKYIDQEFQPFILTASPHFYENAIRDWLYQNKIYTAEIFLKDYRKIISIVDGLLTTKDLKSQGFYKLNHLVNILIMTGIPEELVLMGDGFESDPLIYLTLVALLENRQEPLLIWDQIKKLKSFKLNRKQDSLFLSRVYELQNEIKRKNVKCSYRIYIRRPEHIKKISLPLPFLEKAEQLIEYYQDSKNPGA